MLSKEKYNATILNKNNYLGLLCLGVYLQSTKDLPQKEYRRTFSIKKKAYNNLQHCSIFILG